MSQTTGKTSTYIKNTNVKESSQIQTGFKNTRFLHQAAAGDTLIQLTGLTAPTGTTNYSAPSVSDLSKTNLMQWGSNLRLTSSIAGLLIQNIAYTITGATTIKLLYDAQDGEIFEGVIDHQSRTGVSLVDAAPIVSTGTLAAGQTDFNVGTPFQVGLYSANQVGAVMVFVDGQLMKRNTGNNAAGSGVEGDYCEVHSGGGLGQVIRFNMPDLINDRQVMVISVNGLVERPNGSFMAVMETIQGQIDGMVPTLAALAGVSTTTFQSVPNNTDLKSFGDRVLSQENRIVVLENAKVVLENAKVVVEYVYNSNTADSDDTSSFATGSGGVSFGAYTGTPRRKRVQFSDVCGAKDVIQLELLQSGAWTPLGSNSRYVMPAINATQGVFLEPQSDARQFDVAFQGSVREPGGSTWSSIAGSAIFKWRVARYRYGV